jgi:DNA mismatch repair protein MutS
MQEKEYEIFCEIRDKISEKYSLVKKISKNTALIDLISSFAKVAYKNNYSRPEIVNSYDLEIKK